MEFLVQFAIVALLLLGPRRHGGMPSRMAIALGIAFLIWLALAFGIGRMWQAVFGPIAQP